METLIKYISDEIKSKIVYWYNIDCVTTDICNEECPVYNICNDLTEIAEAIIKEGGNK